MAKAMPGGGLHAYKCGEFWHLGHLPAGLKHGVVDRRDFVTPPARDRRSAGRRTA